MVRPDRFHISLEKSIYFPGEIIKGNLHLITSQPIKCRGLRVHIQGKGHCRFTHHNGEKTEVCTNTQFYTNCRRTFYGNVHMTPVIDEAGSNAIFGPPWAPDEGVLFINLPYDATVLILQAMDHNWTKKDVVLGEVAVEISQCVGRGEMQCHLLRNGRPETGLIFFEMNWDEEHSNLTDVIGNPLRCLRVRIIRAIGLRNLEMIGKNDVYVRAYALPLGQFVQPGQSLPEPIRDITLPLGELNIPFQFQLPGDLPSSIARTSTDYIVYSMYANIDISWRQDPSTRAFFTVMQPNPASAFMNPRQQSLTQNIYKQAYLPPCCCYAFNLDCMGAEGILTCIASCDRGAYAPGEEAMINVNFGSTWPEALNRTQAIEVSLLQQVKLSAEGHYHYHTYLASEPFIVGPQSKEIIFPIPSTSPTYRGGLGHDDAIWFRSMAQYGNRWCIARPDPITWEYAIAIDIVMSLPTTGLAMCIGNPTVTRKFSIKLPILITALGLALLPPSQQQIVQYQQQLHQMHIQGEQQQHIDRQINAIQNASIDSQMVHPQHIHQFMPGMVPQNGMSGGIMTVGAPVMMQPTLGMPAGINGVMVTQPMIRNDFTGIVQQPAQGLMMVMNQSGIQMIMGPPGPMIQPGAPGGMMFSPPNMFTSNQVHPYNPQVAFSQEVTLQPQIQNFQQSQQSHPNSSVSNTQGFTDAYGFSTAIKWKDDSRVKEALPALRLCQVAPSHSNACVIRDPEEDYTVNDNNDLTYKPVFYMSPPKRT